MLTLWLKEVVLNGYLVAIVLLEHVFTLIQINLNKVMGVKCRVEKG